MVSDIPAGDGKIEKLFFTVWGELGRGGRGPLYCVLLESVKGYVSFISKR